MLKIFGSMDVKITLDICSELIVLIYLLCNWLITSLGDGAEKKVKDDVLF